MRPNAVSWLVFAALVSVALATVVQTLPPSPMPDDVSAADFSAGRAVKHIRIIAAQPHPKGSSANAAARAYIAGVLKDLGLETGTQRVGDLENVVARIVGTRSSDAVLLTAHLDSVSEGPGATDDGSGVAVLLETARALVSAGPVPNTVIFLFTDDEEAGNVGAQAFIANHSWTRDVRIVIGLDAGGLRGPGVLSATSAGNGWLIRQVARADHYLTGSSAINALAESGTDFGRAFKQAGFPGYAFDLYWDRRIHTPEDNLANVNLSSLQHQGYHALSLARHFGNLDRITDPKEPDAIFFTVLRLATIAYSSTWAVPLAIGVAALFSGVLAYGRRRRILSWGGMGYGALTMLAGLVVAPLPGILLGRSIPGVPIRFIGRSLDQPLEVSVTVLLALSLIVLVYFLAHSVKSVALPDLAIGALIPMLPGMIGTSIALPALSFAVTWPLLLSLLACASWFCWPARRENGQPLIVGLLVSGAADIVIMGPTILLGMFDQPLMTLLLLGALCAFLLPQIHLMLGSRRVAARPSDCRATALM